MTTTSASLETKQDFPDTPSGQQKYWEEEIRASKFLLKDWKEKGDKIIQRFLGKQPAQLLPAADTTSLNLFHANVTTLGDMMYGNTPKIDVSRRYSDPNDDVARVAALALERLLNLDVAENGGEVDTVFRSALQDRLLPGMGCARVRYTVETDNVGTEDAPEEQMVAEDAPIEYYYWGDVLWPWGRSFIDLPWLAYRNYLTKDEVLARFGAPAAENIPLKKQMRTSTDESERNPDTDSAWMKAEIWEIWDKTKGQVVWFAEGYHEVLDTKPDTLKLKGFFPSPPFLMANPTTSLYVPTPDFVLSQDLYNEIDQLSTRIGILTTAVKAVGVYDASADGIQQMFQEGIDNKLIPVDNWALFAEKGGLQGQIDWVPIMDIVGALDKLRELRTEQIGLLQQVTGMSDIMRGELGGQYEGVGQSQMKAKFGSIRIQALQDQFAQFASDLMQLKAEVIARHFDPETIAKRSNLQQSPDAELLRPAIDLIKNPNEATLRVAIRPESVAMVDFAELKNERTEYINALSTFMQSAAPLMDQDPSAKPFLLQLLQWGLAGFKGASEIEGVIDRAIEASAEAEKAQEGQPDPEQQAMQMQQQMAMQLEQAKVEGQMAVVQAKSQADQTLREQDRQADIETEMARHQTKMAELQANNAAKMAEIEAKLLSDIRLEEIQSGINAQQHAAQVGNEMQKDQASTQLEIQKEATKTSLKIQEMAASTAGKIKETQAKPTPSKGGAND